MRDPLVIRWSGAPTGGWQPCTLPGADDRSDCRSPAGRDPARTELPRSRARQGPYGATPYSRGVAGARRRGCTRVLVVTAVTVAGALSACSADSSTTDTAGSDPDEASTAAAPTSTSA